MALDKTQQDQLDAWAKKSVDPKVGTTEKNTDGQAMMAALGSALTEPILDAAIVKAKMGR